MKKFLKRLDPWRLLMEPGALRNACAGDDLCG